ncbi:VOC family protein [Actinomadura sp. NPDC000600]|uniref:VOC family protein n=1 Tax=Actinomadura sp. NPDC000600 TaxID=3154262 RepID=UPI00339B8729
MNRVAPKSRQIWHAGFIVDELEPAMDELSAALGVKWADLHTIKRTMEGPGGAAWDLDTRVVFSLDLPLSIELIEPSPGTPNVRRGDSAFHHLGYWGDDLVAEERRMADLGLPCVAFLSDQADPALRRILITQGPYDVLLEATSTLTSRPGLEHFYPSGGPR